MAYYVLIGKLISNTQWEQKYLVPFATSEEAEAYKESLSKHVDGLQYDVFIIQSYGHIPEGDWTF